jgi:iron-sulfur cluster assembly protein
METVAMQSPALAAAEGTPPPAAVAAPPPPTTPMLEISESAILRLRDVAAEQGVELVGVRVGVSGGGCSGLSYVLDFEKAPRLGDSVFGDNPKVFVDRKSLVFLRGTTLDFEGGLNGKGFVFKNPNAKASCGCGSSFSV